jgi:hypothetical protein
VDTFVELLGGILALAVLIDAIARNLPRELHKFHELARLCDVDDAAPLLAAAHTPACT